MNSLRAPKIPWLLVPMCLLLATQEIVAQDLGTTETPVNTATALNQNQSDIAVAADGSYLAVWQDVTGADTGAVKGQLFSSNAQPDGPNFSIGSGAGIGAGRRPAVAALSGGGWAVAWYDQFDNSGSSAIWAHLVGATGSLIGDPIAINEVGAGHHIFPDVAGLTDGGFVVVWQSPSAEDTEIHFRRYDGAGSPVTSEDVANAVTEGAQRYPSVAAAPDGGYLIAWEGRNPDPESDNLHDVWVRRFMSNNLPVSAEGRANVYNDGRQGQPAIVPISAGYAIAWSGAGPGDDSCSNNYCGTFLSVLNSNGQIDLARLATDEEVLVNVDTSFNQEKPDLAVDDSGNLIVTWEGGPNGNFDVHARRAGFDGAGNLIAVGSEQQLNTVNINFDQLSPAVAMQDDGDWMVVWESNLLSGLSDTDIFRRSFTTNHLGDFVWLDADEDGIQDAVEPGVAGMRVNLKNDSGTQVSWTLSDTDGSYGFRSIPAADYSLEFVAPPGLAHSPQDSGGDDALDSDADEITGITSLFAIADGSADESRDAGVFAVSPTAYGINLDGSEFDDRMNLENLEGRQLVDIEVLRVDGQQRYSGVWTPTGGQIHTLIEGDNTAWQNFLNQMTPLDGRWLDIEVGIFAATKRYSAIFLEDGDNYSFFIDTLSTDDQFIGLLEQNQDAGRSLVDFEAYLDPAVPGQTVYAGIWVDDPNQPRTALYYGLEHEDLSDLIRPLAGRIIDFERYWSVTHGENRYAVIVATVPGAEWAHFRGITDSQLAAHVDAQSDPDTHLIDIEFWESGAELRFGAVWGDEVKSMWEVARIAPETDVEPLTQVLIDTIAQFEDDGTDTGQIGFYARNLRTGQSFEYMADSPFYLASSTKVAIHAKLFQEAVDGNLDIINDTIAYTNGVNQRDEWYVDQRCCRAWFPSQPGNSAGNPAICTASRSNCPGFNATHFGQSFPLERFDRAMIRNSDNGATSALVAHPTFGLAEADEDLNEWLGGLSGIGQGFGPITSIQELDRLILWQGQVEEHPNEDSFFQIPAWAFEPWNRTAGTDIWGDLVANAPSGGIPETDKTIGNKRYYAMGLNSATPRAFGRLLEALTDGSLLGQDQILCPYIGPSPPTMQSVTMCALSITESTDLNDSVSWPANASIQFAKGGSKGGASKPVSNTAIVRVGSGTNLDFIVMGVFTQDNSRKKRPIRDDFVPVAGLQFVEGLGVNLSRNTTQSVSAQASAAEGGPIEVTIGVRNEGGGDAPPFDVDFVLSDDDRIGDSDDVPIGTFRVPGLPGHSTTTVNLVGTVPEGTNAGIYLVGWFIDSQTEAPEFDEGDNRRIYISLPATEVVIISSEIFSDGFEGGSTSIWSSAQP